MKNGSRLEVRLDEEETKLLDTLKEHFDSPSASAVVKRLIREKGSYVASEKVAVQYRRVGHKMWCTVTEMLRDEHIQYVMAFASIDPDATRDNLAEGLLAPKRIMRASNTFGTVYALGFAAIPTHEQMTEIASHFGGEFHARACQGRI